MTKIQRKTKETEITVEFKASGGAMDVQLPDLFLAHCLEAFAKHGRFGLRVRAISKDKDAHHLAEDVAITLGQAIRAHLEAGPVARFGHEILPMDDALVEVVVDAGGRIYYEGRLPNPLHEHLLRSLATEAGLTLHVDVRRGREEHHVTEAAFKALGRALRRALEPVKDVASTKGRVRKRGG